jgi:hypothetical protein
MAKQPEVHTDDAVALVKQGIERLKAAPDLSLADWKALRALRKDVNELIRKIEGSNDA